MAKELHEISKFMTGTVTVPSETDIPDDAASYSKNIDPVAEDGILKGIPNDLTLTAGGFITAAQPEITKIVCVADVGSNLDRTYMDLYSGAGKVKVWFDIDNDASGEPSGSAGAYADSIEVTNANANHPAESIAIAIGEAINSDGDEAFIASVNEDIVYVTDIANAERTNASAGDTGFTVTTIQGGASGTAGLGIAADKIAMINDDGTHRVVYFDDVDDKIKKIDDIHSGSVSTAALSGSAESKSVVPTMQVNNKEVHIGMGNGATNKPLWCGIVPHSQFGTAVSGLQLEDAELKNPSPFPDIYKAVIGSDGDYIYGIEWQGTHVYKFNIATSKVVKRSEKIFTQVQGLCLSSDGNLWVVDNLSGTMHLIKIDTENMLDTIDVTFTSTGTIANISDIIEIGTKIWFSKYGVSYGNTVNANGWGIWNDDVADFVAGASEQTLAGKTPYRGVSSGTPAEGSWSDHGVSPDAIEVMFTAPKVALIDVGDNTKCGWVTLVDLDNGLNGSADADGSPVYFVKSSDDEDDVPASTVIQMIDEDASHFGLIAASSGGRLVRLNGSTDYQSGSNIIHSFTNGVDGVISYGVNDAVSNAVQFFNNGASSGRITYAGNAQGDSTAGHSSVEASTSVKNAFVLSVTDSTTKYHAFQGFGVGRWAYGAAGSLAVKLEAEVELTLGTATGSWTAWTGSTDRHFYKVSYVYDGYQEGPLSDDFSTVYPADAAHVVTVEISLKSLSTLSKRISHVNLYRSTSTTTTDARPTGFYRLVGNYKLNESWKEIVDSTSNPSWGNYRQKDVVDNGNVTTSYDALNGISETLKDTLPNYALSAQLNNIHFIAKCYHPDLDDASAYLFKSQPYNFDQFDWSLDLLRLPTIPTALASFQGRVYAFDENNTYKIEPNNLYIEDTFEGVGCIGPDAVVVTEYGMCFADKNNIYLHSGAQPVSIGDSILRGDNTSWQNRDTTWVSKVIFDAKRNSFVVLFKYSSNYYAWTYNIARKRWDLWEVFGSTEPLGTLAGKSGEMFISNGTNLMHYLGHASTTRAWDWSSKKLIMGQNTQTKVFKRTRVAGNTTDCIDTFLSSEGTPTDDSGAADGTTGYVYNLSGANTRAKWIQYKITAEANTVDSIGTIYRRRPVK